MSAERDERDDSRPASWRRYLRFWGANPRADVDEEISFHMESLIAGYLAQGMTPLDHVVFIHDNLPKLPLLETALDPTETFEMTTRNDLFAAAGGYWNYAGVLTGEGTPQRIASVRTLGRFFDVFAQAPAVGRFYRPDESENGRHRVAVLAYDFWQELGGKLSIVGIRFKSMACPMKSSGWQNPDSAIRAACSFGVRCCSQPTTRPITAAWSCRRSADFAMASPEGSCNPSSMRSPRGFIRTRGFKPDHVATVRVAAAGQKFSKPEALLAFYEDFLNRLKGPPACHPLGWSASCRSVEAATAVRSG